MWCFNKDPDNALSFIRETDADIFCLQEVPHEFLPKLEQLPYQLAYATDFRWITDFLSRSKSTSICHLVILSKYPLSNIERLSADILMFESLQYKLFRMLMHYVAGWAGPTVERGILFADVSINNSPLRIFCVHLPLYSADVRTNELSRVFENLKHGTPNVVCGDFNILDHWTMKPLNWFIGNKFTQALPWFNERKEKEVLFKEAGLTNPLIGMRTQVIAHSQLDHILVPNGTDVLERKVFQETHGSDHNPVMLQVNI